MTLDPAIELVSVHGGHSGQFCSHAEDSLEAVIKAYIKMGFTWVGITEHIPPLEECFLYPEEKHAGHNLDSIRQRFGDYVITCREMQKKYVEQICIYMGFETEAYPGALNYVETLKLKYKPDYIVGSVHHINGIAFDLDMNTYAKALRYVGGYEALYRHYFDRQFELICKLKPEVIGHFDLIRIFDPHYNDHLHLPAVWKRICRNLERITEYNLILDYNLRALSKGAQEPYVADSILKQALSLGIALVPGDDSHGVASVGNYIEEGIDRLLSAGANPQWPRPIRATEYPGGS